MASPGIWLAESLVLGIIMAWIGVLLIRVSMPLAKGQVRASQYNYRPVRLYRLTDEERDLRGKPTAWSAVAIGGLFVLAGLASVAIGLTGRAGPGIMYLFLGTVAVALLLLAVTLIASLLFVGRVRRKCREMRRLSVIYMPS